LLALIKEGQGFLDRARFRDLGCCQCVNRIDVPPLAIVEAIEEREMDAPTLIIPQQVDNVATVVGGLGIKSPCRSGERVERWGGRVFGSQ